MSSWTEPGLPRFLIDAALAGVTIGFVGWLVSLALTKAKTEWRLSAILAVLISLMAVPFTVTLGQNLGTGRVPSPVADNVRQTRGIAQQEQTGQVFSKLAPFASPKVVQEGGLSPYVVGGTWAVFTGAWLLLAVIRLALLRRWLKRNAIPQGPLVRRITLFRAEVAAPFCGGIFKPFIVIPVDFEDLPEAERRAVTTHEIAHLELRHPMQKLVGEIAIALFGWVPFVPLLTRQLSDLQERQSDEAVIRQEGDGIGLAKGLVRFAERRDSQMQPAATLSIVRRRSRLEGRVQRLVKTGGLSMPPKKPIVTFAALTIGVVLTAVGLAAQSGKNPLAEAKAFMPFRPGTTMNYKVTDSDGNISQFTMTATSLQENKPYPVMEFQRKQTASSWYEYWMATPQGLVPLDNRRLTGEPGFSFAQDKGTQMPSPANQGYEWTWSEAFRGQTMMRRDGTPPPPPPPTKYRGKVVAVDQTVKVPFGTVKATVIDITTESRYNFTTRTYWAKNVGIVKREHTDQSGNFTTSEELVSVTQGKR